ncbi:MAG: DNA polymerase I, partial [Clostridiales bacterium]|nr:DNA polymerase I [Clostridiales bacterium]
LRKMDASGRVHTYFDQTGTATGRISSSEPNLQNIPVRTEMGREIRKAFIAKPGCVLADADYSQIELRVLAHFSGDHAMVDAFQKGQDIHTRTAAEVYDVAMEEVTAQMRSSAKAVNFGLVYGISDFGLSRNIGISRKEAAAFIDRYFSRYPGVKKFMDDVVKKGYEDGFATTMMGRRRQLPELKASNANTRNFGERAAMNTPVQGTAADIIKLAMVRVHEALNKEGLKARLILQVHDELMIEAPNEESEAVVRILRASMEQVAALSVPLIAEVKTGESWYETK